MSTPPQTPQTPQTPQKIKNLGPVSWRALARVGIKDAQTLRHVGAVAAYVLVLEQGEKPSLNFLYAMAAGLTDRHWADVSKDEKGRLNREVADFHESRSPRPV